MPDQLLLDSDLSKLTPQERVDYYNQLCESLRLNPLTKPFEYIWMSSKNEAKKLVLYAKRNCTDQLRRRDQISIQITGRETINDIYLVTAQASDPSGRTDESIGAVSISGLAGSALANAIMIAETKAKSRVTLSICGLGWSDETEITTIPGASLATVSSDGEISGVDQEHYCTEHGKHYALRTSKTTGNTRWCHQHLNGWCLEPLVAATDTIAVDEAVDEAEAEVE